MKKGISSFEGNQARKYLKRAGKLEDKVKADTSLPQETKDTMLLVAKAMKTLNLVVHACFGMVLKDKHGDYKDLIKKYTGEYRAIPGLSVIVKQHCLETHVVEFLDMKGDGVKGLGYWSEQSYEASHFHYKHEADKTKLTPDHENYLPNMLNTVLRFCGRNM